MFFFVQDNTKTCQNLEVPPSETLDFILTFKTLAIIQ